jgi:hypothetical protein
MMGLKSLLTTSQEKREGSILSVEDKPSYPMGLRLELDEETVKKLGLSEMPDVGSFMHLLGKAEVIVVRKEEGRGDDHSFSMTLQLQDADLKPEASHSKVSNKLYGDS